MTTFGVPVTVLHTGFKTVPSFEDPGFPGSCEAEAAPFILRFCLGASRTSQLGREEAREVAQVGTIAISPPPTLHEPLLGAASSSSAASSRDVHKIPARSPSIRFLGASVAPFRPVSVQGFVPRPTRATRVALRHAVGIQASRQAEGLGL